MSVLLAEHLLYWRKIKTCYWPIQIWIH